MNALRSLSTLMLVCSAASGCGNDAGPAIDAMPGASDALPTFSDGAGVACAGAKALYSGTVFNPSAEDDGSVLSFSGNLDAASEPATLELRVASGNAPAGSLPLPDGAWSVSICPTGGEACAGELVAYSGTLQVTSTEDRLQASLSEIIFVDDLTAPTCSAALSQSTIDVAISGPP